MTLPRYFQPRYVALYVVLAWIVRGVVDVAFAAESRGAGAEIAILFVGGALSLAIFASFAWLAFRPDPVPWSSFLRPSDRPTFSLFQWAAFILTALVCTYGCLIVDRYVPILLGRAPARALLHQETFAGMSFVEFFGRREAMPFILSSCLIAPIVEEITFRGFFLNVLVRRHSVLYAVAVSSVVFAVSHLRDIPGGSLVGMVLALAYLTSGSVVLPICVHATHNFSVLVLYYYLGIGRVKDLTALRDPSQWYVELTAFVLMIPVVIVIWRWSMNHLAAKKNVTASDPW